MDSNTATHPTTTILQAFSAGKLDENGAGTVRSHLDSCPECRQKLAGLSLVIPSILEPKESRKDTGASLDMKTWEPASPAASPSTELPAPLVNNPQYEIVRELGRGGMGVVYLAKNKMMDRPEVLKVVNKSLLEHPAAQERFLREIRSAAKLNHPNVVTAYSMQMFDNLLVFAMEYIEGSDLDSVVNESGPLPVANACYYVHQAALGLQHAFEKGMVHRDIKPQNLILAKHGKKHVAKILDFGLAKAASEKTVERGLTAPNMMLGTPGYVAPEQTTDAAKADIRADIYSLGCTLYFLLTGKEPFPGTSLFEILQAHHMVVAKPVNEVRPEVPRALADIVAKMMAKKPADRYQKPIEVAQALMPFVKQEAGKPVAPEVKPEPIKPAAPEVKPKPIEVAPPPSVAEESAKFGTVAWVEQFERDKLKQLGKQDANKPAGRKRTGNRKRGGVTMLSSPRKWWPIAAGIGGGLVAVVLLTLWVSGAFKGKPKEGILVLENLPPDAEVFIDGEAIAFVRAGEAEPVEIKVLPGARKLEIKKVGFQPEFQELVLAAGDRKPIAVHLVPKTIEKTDDGVVMTPKRLPSLKLVKIPAKGKTFTMGSVDTKDAPHEVTLSADYYMGVTTVTRGQFAEFVKDSGHKTEAETDGFGGVGYDPEKRAFLQSSRFTWKDAGFPQGDDHPVLNVSWQDAQAFCTWLSVRESKKYRLPTEAEWEFACRGGTTTRFYFGDDENQMPLYGNVADKSLKGTWDYSTLPEGPYKKAITAWFDRVSWDDGYPFTAPVGQFKPNAFGLYDMHGNVAQWCEDWFAEYPKAALTDPLGPSQGSSRIIRGGSWRNDPAACASARRVATTLAVSPLKGGVTIGFRIVSGPEIKPPPPTAPPEITSPTLPALKLVKIPAKGKTFTMGSPPNEMGRPDEERPHEVSFTSDFDFAVGTVTHAQFEAFVNDTKYKTDAEKAKAKLTWLNPGFKQTNDHPVVCVSYNDAVEFCKWLSRIDGQEYRLPTEAEWEYACRAGTKTAYSFGDDANKLLEYAWFNANSGGGPHPKAQKKPNEFGLYDMHGNVWQWCADWYGDYPLGPVTDPKGPATGSRRVARGGSWYNPAPVCRSAYRHQILPSEGASANGFRVVRSWNNQDKAPTEMTSNRLPSLKFARIPAKGKTFSMGSPPTEAGRPLDAERAHQVTLTADYYVGVTPITRGQFAAYVKEKGPTEQEKAGKKETWRNPGFEQTDDHPVVWVSHNDALGFCAWLSAKDGREYRLPTEAEWEYACRAGTKTAYFFGNDRKQLGDYAWFDGNSNKTTHPVAAKKPNPWGLFDMNGNVFQWCSDWWAPGYPAGPVVDPKGPPQGTMHVLRGGSWRFDANWCRSAMHPAGDKIAEDNLGFRIVATVR